MSTYRVLIVDDQREVRRVLRAALETLGQDVKVTDVPSGEEAILVISRQPVDLLITDVRLPGISGLELKDRARVRNPDMRMILITGLTEPKVRREVERAGVDGYFFKPIEMPPFLDLVQSFLTETEQGRAPAPEQAVTSPPPAAVQAVSARPSVPAAPAALPPAPPPPPTPTLADRLSSLRQELNAEGALLLDERGQVVAQAGDLLAELGGEAALPKMAALFDATLRLSLHMGVNLPRGLLYLPGPDYDLFLTNVGQNVGLLVLTRSKIWDETRLGGLLKIARQAARDLLEMLATWGVQLAETPAATSPAVLEEELPEVPEEDLASLLPELDAIFGKVDPGQLKTEEVDAFWDALTAGPPEDLARSDSLTFDQARQLGLAPDGN